MYQSFIYLETRILLDSVPGVFIPEGDGYTVKTEVLKKIGALAKALECSINEKSTLERLTGTLPKIPEDKKITGYSLSIAKGGSLDIMFHQKAKKINIEEMRIEEDCGRLTHSSGQTHMDFTYAGCPSLRLKTAASFELGEEAELFLDELKRLMQYLHLMVPGMKDDGIRSNAYVALADYPSLPAYYVKLRNLNSFNFVRKAINMETSRQENILSSGGIVADESRLWNAEQNVTESWQARKHENRRFEDYEPHTEIPVAFLIDNLNIPVMELPKDRRLRFRKQYGLSRLRSEFICDDKDRADFYEKAVACGAEPLMAAHWIASEVMRFLNFKGIAISESLFTPENFAEVIKYLASQKIHSGIAKDLIQKMGETGMTVDEILSSSNKMQISDPKKIMPYVHMVLSENRSSCRRLQMGDMAPLEYLTGIVMKETGGRAVPLTVKALIKQELQISIVYVLGMGGAMTAHRRKDGSIESGNEQILKELCHSAAPEIPVQIATVRSLLSEEMEPQDFAVLISEISNRISAGSANGIVVVHGTDTLPYTAALLYWLFSDMSVPVVLTASNSIPEDSPEEAKKNLQMAIKVAKEKRNGVYVVYNGKVLSPLNLKFEKPTEDGFRNWNLKEAVFTESGPLALQFATITEPDSSVMSRLIEDSANKMLVFRTYPGFKSDRYEQLIDENLDTFFLELYASGTGNMRHGDYTLKNILLKGRRKGCHIYCTSQQESKINFSNYVTSASVWREGAVPMGRLTTESAIALYYAASLLSDSSNELAEIMENYAELYS
ncbi:MAG: asparaginase domain-containing protein [Treponema sp.]|nr:asparaginase domain-containing protein [Treponema sp.]